jgi:hypothetical protein
VRDEWSILARQIGPGAWTIRRVALQAMKLAALVALAACSSSSPAHLQFMDNDADGARGLALVRHVPIFVEAWAPW